MGKRVFLHFTGKLPRNTKDKAVVATVFTSDWDGYNAILKKTKVVSNPQMNNKFTGLMALTEAFDVIHEEQLSMLRAGVSNVYLVTDSPLTYSYLTGTSSNDYVRQYLHDLYLLYSFGGPKELRIGVGVADLCYRNSAKSRCDVNLIKEEQQKEEEQKGNDLVYCFFGTEGKSLSNYIKVPDIFGMDEGTKLEDI